MILAISGGTLFFMLLLIAVVLCAYSVSKSMKISKRNKQKEQARKEQAQKEEDKGKVIDVTEKGYKLKDKVIRYAKVVVGQ